MASYRNCPQITKLLQQSGADASERHPGGGAAHYAAKGGALASIQMLKSLGIDLDTFNLSGRSPLSMAVEAEQADMVNYLLRQGGCRKTFEPGQAWLSLA